MSSSFLLELPTSPGLSLEAVAHYYSLSAFVCIIYYRLLQISFLLEVDEKRFTPLQRKIPGRPNIRFARGFEIAGLTVTLAESCLRVLLELF